MPSDFLRRRSPRLGLAHFWLDEHGLLVDVSDVGIWSKGQNGSRGAANACPIRDTDTLIALQQSLCYGARGCVLGGQFRDLQAAMHCPKQRRLDLTGFQAGRQWLGSRGSHDPEPVALGVEHWRGSQRPALLFAILRNRIRRRGIGGITTAMARLRLRRMRYPRRLLLYCAKRLIMPSVGYPIRRACVSGTPRAQIMGIHGPAPLLTGRQAHRDPHATLSRSHGGRISTLKKRPHGSAENLPHRGQALAHRT